MYEVEGKLFSLAAWRWRLLNRRRNKTMDAALGRAGKKHELIFYRGLDHDLDDSAARTDLLARSAQWLAAAMPAK
ncbi:MAG: hypothetical protein DCF31_02035 [Alphaproteobacteria bacterium]|nr:MAG: hypothetical protein DCF31_02035 [Alphaproteobacteria bacterium]